MPWKIILLSAMIIIAAEGHFDADDIREKLQNWALNNQIKTNFQPMSRESPVQETFACTACKTNLQQAIDSYRNGTLTIEQTEAYSESICVIVFGYSDYVCKGFSRLLLPVFTYIITNEPRVNADAFCGLFLQRNNPENCVIADERFEFTIPLPERSSNKDNKNTTRRKPTNEILNLVHLSDPHVDPEYLPGSITNCDAPLCCREGVNATSESTAAGYWGDYGTCDSPYWVFNDVLSHVVENNEKIDMIYFTGDIVDHALWKTTPESIEKEITFVYDRLKETFEALPLYPCVGNHEGQPMGSFAPPYVTSSEIGSNGLYELLIEKWSPWLPESTFETIRKGGYYTVLARPGLRIISLNTNLAYVFNWWICLEPNDPSGQLKWLVDTLHAAEKEEERVHIITHIPPGSGDIYYTWRREYKRIIDRFAHVIASEFDGHTHRDQFKLFYENDDIEKPNMVAWNGGAMVTFSDTNINYKVFTVDGNTYVPLDFDTYTYNLTEANLTPEKRPNWFKEYSFKETYGVKSLLPKDIDELLNEMASTKRHLLDIYIQYYGKQGDAYLQTVTNARQLQGVQYDLSVLCEIVTTNLGYDKKCEQLSELFNSLQ